MPNDLPWRCAMSDLKGEKLFVNLGASQARRRLKGFGHGVRKVQSAGRNQAVIIHTALGIHLQELEARFADVGFGSHESDLGQSVANPIHETLVQRGDEPESDDEDKS
jgi:DNA transformation protein and related proteins